MNKVIIIGAGPAGLKVALHLHKSNNISPVIYEVRSEATSLGGALGIPSNGSRLLERLGLHKKLLARASSSSELTIHSVKGRVIGKMDTAAWSKEKTVFVYMRIKRAELMDVLLQATQEAGILIQYGNRFVKIEENEGVTVIFSDDTSDTADFLIGCDGIHSTVRKTYVDPDIAPEYPGICNIFSIVPTSRLPPAAVSIEGLNATVTIDGLIALTPCTSSRDSLYWFFSRAVYTPISGHDCDAWEERGKKEVDEFKSKMHNLLKDIQGEWGGMLRKVVDETDVVKFYPIYKLPLGGRWSRR